MSTPRTLEESLLTSVDTENTQESLLTSVDTENTQESLLTSQCSFVLSSWLHIASPQILFKIQSLAIYCESERYWEPFANVVV